MDNKEVNELNQRILIEEYRSRKQEIASSINHQYGILTMVVAATSAVLALIGSRLQLAVACIGLLLPGTYAFFGSLWMDAVYRQRRSGVYIYKIEEKFGLDGKTFGWEHYIKENGEKRHFRFIKKAYRQYYFICMGLFFCIPFMMILFAVRLSRKMPSEYNSVCIIIGMVFFIASVYFAVQMYLDIEDTLSESRGDQNMDNKVKAAIPSCRFLIFELITPFLLGVCVLAIGGELEKSYGMTIQEAFTGKEPEPKLIYMMVCFVLLLAGIILWQLNWKYVNKKYPCFIDTVNALHRLFIDASLVFISSAACWYSMMESGMEKIPKSLFVFIVPIAISVVIIDCFKIYHEYIQDAEKAKSNQER